MNIAEVCGIQTTPEDIAGLENTGMPDILRDDPTLAFDRMVYLERAIIPLQVDAFHLRQDSSPEAASRLQLTEAELRNYYALLTPTREHVDGMDPAKQHGLYASALERMERHNDSLDFSSLHIAERTLRVSLRKQYATKLFELEAQL